MSWTAFFLIMCAVCVLVGMQMLSIGYVLGSRTNINVIKELMSNLKPGEVLSGEFYVGRESGDDDDKDGGDEEPNPPFVKSSRFSKN